MFYVNRKRKVRLNAEKWGKGERRNGKGKGLDRYLKDHLLVGHPRDASSPPVAVRLHAIANMQLRKRPLIYIYKDFFLSIESGLMFFPLIHKGFRELDPLGTIGDSLGTVTISDFLRFSLKIF